MYLQRAAFLWVGGLLGFLACSTAPTSGTSTSSTSSTTTTTGTGGTGGGSGGTGGSGGMEAGTCAPRQDYYDFCGDCRRCIEEKCCAEAIACDNAPGCIDCVSNNPDAAGPCGQHDQLVLEACSVKCDACHSPIPNPGCFPDAGADGG